MAGRLLTPEEAAELLHMSHPRTVVAWARRGYLPAHALGEGRRRIWRFVESELMQWVAKQGNERGGAK